MKLESKLRLSDSMESGAWLLIGMSTYGPAAWAYGAVALSLTRWVLRRRGVLP